MIRAVGRLITRRGSAAVPLGAAAALAGALLLMAGCGGSGATGGQPRDISPAAKGKIRVTVRFPRAATVESQALPAATRKVRIRVTGENIPNPIVVDLRPSDNDEEVSATIEVTAGRCEVYAQAQDADNWVLAAGSASVDVEAYKTTTAKVTLTNDCWKRIGPVSIDVSNSMVVWLFYVNDRLYLLAPGVLAELDPASGAISDDTPPPPCSSQDQAVVTSNGKIYLAAASSSCVGLHVAVFDTEGEDWVKCLSYDPQGLRPSGCFKPVGVARMGRELFISCVGLNTSGSHYVDCCVWKIDLDTWNLAGVRDWEYIGLELDPGCCVQLGNILLMSTFWSSDPRGESLMYDITGNVLSRGPAVGDACGGGDGYAFCALRGKRYWWQFDVAHGGVRHDLMSAPAPVLACTAVPGSPRYGYMLDTNHVLWRYDKSLDTFRAY